MHTCLFSMGRSLLVVGAPALLFVAAPGCLDTETSEQGGDTGSADNNGDNDGGDDGVDACVPNQSDGRTACSAEECSAGEYCFADFSCSAGCASTLNCATGQWCDLRMSAEDSQGVEIGVCRATSDPFCEGPADDTAADDGEDEVVVEECLDVQGNYALSSAAGSPQACEAFIDGDQMCSVAQDGCDITWGCGPQLALLFVPGSLDANSVYETQGTQMGIDYTCEVRFSSDFDLTFSWDCSFTLDGEAVVCQGQGTT